MGAGSAPGGARRARLATAPAGEPSRQARRLGAAAHALAGPHATGARVGQAGDQGGAQHPRRARGRSGDRGRPQVRHHARARRPVRRARRPVRRARRPVRRARRRVRRGRPGGGAHRRAPRRTSRPPQSSRHPRGVRSGAPSRRWSRPAPPRPGGPETTAPAPHTTARARARPADPDPRGRRAARDGGARTGDRQLGELPDELGTAARGGRRRLGRPGVRGPARHQRQRLQPGAQRGHLRRLDRGRGRQ